MRKIFYLLVILSIAVFATPGVVGFQAQERYQLILAQIEQSGFRIERSEYNRGWFQSEAKTDFLLSLPKREQTGKEGLPEDIRFTLRSDISHGPLSPVGGLAIAHIESEILSEQEPIFPEDYPATIKTNLDLSGEGITRIDLPSFTLPEGAERPGVMFKGMTGELRFDAAFSRADFNLSLPQLQFSFPDTVEIGLNNLAVESHSKRGIADLMLGSGFVKLENFEARDPADGKGFVISQADITAETSSQGENLTFNVVYKLQSVDVNGETYGPAELRILLDNLPARAVAKMQREVEEINGQQLTQEQKGMAMMGVFMGLAPQILQADPKLAMERLTVKTPDGIIEGRISIQPRGLGLNELNSIPKLLHKLDAQATLAMPESFFKAMFQQQALKSIQEQIALRRKLGEEVEELSGEDLNTLADSLAQQRVEGFIQQGVLVREEGQLSTMADLSGGLLTVNGKTIPIPQVQ
jgi:uncharacterized protein YdgA (DUF945 family)